MRRDRRLRNGYSDLGPIQIPPRGAAFVLTDRADGTRYLVSWNTDESDVARLSINTSYSTIERKEGVRVYDAYEGPAMDENGRYILMIRNGRIGLDYTPFPEGVRDVDQAPPHARLAASSVEMTLSTEDINPTRARIGINTDD